MKKKKKFAVIYKNSYLKCFLLTIFRLLSVQCAAILSTVARVYLPRGRVAVKPPPFKQLLTLFEGIRGRAGLEKGPQGAMGKYS